MDDFEVRGGWPEEWFAFNAGNMRIVPKGEIKMHGLSPATWDAVRKVFKSDDHAEVESLLVNGCGNNLPGNEYSNEQGLDRVRLAVLKLSNGTIDELRRWVEVARRDWRDALFAAGFAHSLFAHYDWLEKLKAGGQHPLDNQ